MAVLPLRETSDSYDRSKNLSRVELLKDPAILPDYALNLQHEIIRRSGFEFAEKALGLLILNGFAITAGPTAGLVQWSQGTLVFANFLMDIAAGNADLGLGINYTGELYLKITEKRFVSSDAGDAAYGGIDPPNDLRFVAGAETFDTHNEWRFKVEIIGLSTPPSDDENDTTKEYVYYKKLADITSDGSSNISFTNLIAEIDTDLANVLSKTYQDDVARLASLNTFTNGNLWSKGTNVLSTNSGIALNALDGNYFDINYTSGDAQAVQTLAGISAALTSGTRLIFRMTFTGKFVATGNFTILGDELKFEANDLIEVVPSTDLSTFILAPYNKSVNVESPAQFNNAVGDKPVADASTSGTLSLSGGRLYRLTANRTITSINFPSAQDGTEIELMIQANVYFQNGASLVVTPWTAISNAVSTIAYAFNGETLRFRLVSGVWYLVGFEGWEVRVTNALASAINNNADAVGTIKMFAGSLSLFNGSTGAGNSNTDWENWQICDGQNGSYNLTGRVPLGFDLSGGAYPTRGVTGGATTHTLTTAELASHNHSMNSDGSHTHTGTTGGGSSHSHGAGTYSASSAGAHLHTSGTLSAVAAGSHTHASGGDGASPPGNFVNSSDYPSFTADNDGSGSTFTFNLPGNFQGSTDSGGAHTHTMTGSTASNGAHTHTVAGTSAGESAHTHSFTTASSGSHTHTINSNGSGNSHNNMQPYIVVAFVQKMA